MLKAVTTWRQTIFTDFCVRCGLLLRGCLQWMIVMNNIPCKCLEFPSISFGWLAQGTCILHFLNLPVIYMLFVYFPLINWDTESADQTDLLTKNILKIYWVCGFNLPLCACGSHCSVVSVARSDPVETSAASRKRSAAKIQPPARYAAPLTLTRRSRMWGRHQRRREGEVWRSWQTLPAPCWCELMDLKADVCTASVITVTTTNIDCIRLVGLMI